MNCSSFQKGITPVIVVLVLAVILAGAGGAYYLKKQQANPPLLLMLLMKLLTGKLIAADIFLFNIRTIGRMRLVNLQET